MTLIHTARHRINPPTRPDVGQGAAIVSRVKGVGLSTPIGPLSTRLNCQSREFYGLYCETRVLENEVVIST